MAASAARRRRPVSSRALPRASAMTPRRPRSTVRRRPTSWSWSSCAWSSCAWSGARRRCRRLGRGRCSPPCHRPRGTPWGRRGTVGSVVRARCRRCRRRPRGPPATPPRASGQLRLPWRSASRRRQVPGRRRAALRRRERRRQPVQRPVPRAWPAPGAAPGPAPPVGWTGRPHCSVVARSAAATDVDDAAVKSAVRCR